VTAGLFYLSSCNEAEDPEPVTASFTPENSTVKENQTVEFEDHSSGSPDTYGAGPLRGELH
tara:strand:- start:4521 stop:4703 length:183 start_codon:yes stop_codon:yes gene_type:complete